MRSDAKANQRKIVEAATRVMADQGLDAELTDIAEAAGVGMGTVYRCLGNRDRVIETIVREAFGQVAASFAEAEAADDGLEGLVTLLDALYRTIATYGWTYTALVGGRLSTDLRDEVRALDLTIRFERLYQKAQGRGELGKDADAKLATALIFGSLAPPSARALLAERDSRRAAEAVLAVFGPKKKTAVRDEVVRG